MEPVKAVIWFSQSVNHRLTGAPAQPVSSFKYSVGLQQICNTDPQTIHVHSCSLVEYKDDKTTWNILGIIPLEIHISCTQLQNTGQLPLIYFFFFKFEHIPITLNMLACNAFYECFIYMYTKFRTKTMPRSNQHFNEYDDIPSHNSNPSNTHLTRL